MKLYLIRKGNKISSDLSNYLLKGFPITRTKTEELNSGTITLYNIPKLDIQPFDVFQFQIGDTNSFYMMVDTFNPPTPIRRDGFKTYRYDINLISETKMLEKVILPNLSITKRIGGTTTSIRDYLESIFNFYIKSQFPWLVLSTSFNKFTSASPEFVWSTPNAKQVFNDLLSTIPNDPCLVVINNGVVDLIKLNKKNNLITDSGLTSNESYQSQQDYANALSTELKNVIPRTLNSSTFDVRYFLPNDGGALLTTNNACVKLPNARIDEVGMFKILNVEFICHCKTSSSSVNVTIHDDVDLYQYVKEEKVYSTYNVGNSSYKSGYKLGHFSFKQGSDTIDNISYREDKFIGQTDYSINTALINEMNKQNRALNLCKEVNSGVTEVTLIEVNTSILDMQFSIIYKTSSDFKTLTYKDDEKIYDIHLTDNQSNQYVDFPSFKSVEQEKINRLGNEIVVRCQRLQDNEDVNLGDYYSEDGKDFIVAKTTTKYFSNYKIVTSYLSPNFLQKNVYYGLISRQRYLQISEATQSIIRNDITRKVITFKIAKTDDDKSDSIGTYFIRHLVYSSTLPMIEPSAIKQVLLFAETKQVVLETKIFGGDKTTSITCECEDNYSAGMRTEVVNNQVVSKYVPYTNDYGNNNFRVWYLIYNTSISSDESILRQYPQYSSSLINDYEILYSVSENFKKDSREVLKHTFQFDFKGDNDVIIQPQFGLDNSLTSIVKWLPSGHFKIYKSNRRNYMTSDLYAFDDNISNDVVIVLNENKLIFKTLPNAENIQSIAICDNNLNVLIAFNNVKNNLLNGKLIVCANTI